MAISSESFAQDISVQMLLIVDDLNEMKSILKNHSINILDGEILNFETLINDINPAEFKNQYVAKELMKLILTKYKKIVKKFKSVTKSLTDNTVNSGDRMYLTDKIDIKTNKAYAIIKWYISRIMKNNNINISMPARVENGGVPIFIYDEHQSILALIRGINLNELDKKESRWMCSIILIRITKEPII